jgi:hypothetical protein
VGLPVHVGSLHPELLQVGPPGQTAGS